MSKWPKIITKTLSTRLSLMVVGAIAFLLLASLMVMLYFSRKSLKQEALQDAEQTLEATVQHIDNILLSVEQATGNIYWKMQGYLGQPDQMDEYCRKLIENNPYISDCKIVWETDSNTIDANIASWTDPQTKASQGDAVTSFLLPIYKGKQKVGTMVIDVPLALLSKIMLEVKPSPNSFSMLLGKNGSYIIHPDSNKLNHNVFELAKKQGQASVVEAAQAMLNGETGYRRVKLDGENCYVFYKPFKRTEVRGRAMTELGWSAGIVYPENDIFGEYHQLLYTVLVIAIVGLLLLLLLCRIFIHRQFLPLRQLAKSAQRIAEGCYDDPIPDTRHQDEVGRLQRHFQEMQQSLGTRMGEMQQLTDTLQERGHVLQAAYEQAESADRMKTNFLYNMSDQMMAPVSSIFSNVKTISAHYNELTEEETNRLVEEIQQQGGKVTALLNQLISDSEKIM